MRRLLFLGLALCLCLGSSHAGPNSNGAIIVHTNDSYNYSAGTVCTTTLGLPASCAAAITQSNKDFVNLSQTSTVWFLAAFLPTASPRVASVYFGTDVDEVNTDTGTNYGYCGPSGSQQVPDPGWPFDAGNSVGFGSPVLGNTLFRFYFFAVQNWDADPAAPNAWWCSTINQTGGYAAFFDDSFPPNQDNITQFGCVRWYESGQNSCPQAQATGSCCAPDGSCTLTAQIDCASPAIWHGEWTNCSPNNCPQPMGACCATDGSCAITTQAACLTPSVWHADWSTCDPNPCPQPPLPPPSLASPADAAICIPITGVVDWSDVAGATGYKVQIGVACGAGVEHLVTASEFAFTLDPNTLYYWRVATKNVSGLFGEYSACRTFTTEPSLLAAPTLQAPTNSATCQAVSGTLDWSDVPAAAAYRVQIGTAPNAGTEYDVISSTYAYSGLDAGATYYWRVRTKNACGAYGPYSNSFSFTTDGALAAPALLSPANGAIDQTTALTLDWADVAGATAYTVQIGASCGTGVETEVTASENPVSGLNAGATYFWRVKTKNACGTYGAYSACFSFTIAPVPPPTGACCNTATGACTITTQLACNFSWLGADVACNVTNCPVPPATGACCNTATGACTMTTAAACGFSWLGEGVPCNVTNCPVPPATGACCNTATGACTITTQLACNFSWLGADVACNVTNCPVPPATGACCNTATGACTMTTAAACGFSWLGEGVPCNVTNCPVPPATGACCNTATGACTITTQLACNFSWLGADVACNVTNCPVPPATGACCNTATGACTMTTAAACGFTWLGADVACNPSSCPAPPSNCIVKIVFPKGGQNLRAGDPYSVVWTSTGCGPNVLIELLRNGILCRTIASSAPNTGIYPWVAAQCDGYNMGYKVRVTDLSTGGYAESLIPFTISVAPTTMTVNSPNGGETWEAGTHHDIRWTSTYGGPTVKIELLHGGAICTLIDPAAPNNGTFDWLVEGCRGTGGFKIRVTDVSFGIWDQSDRSFDIGEDECHVSVTSPSDHDVWPRGTVHTITWDSRGGCGDYVKLDLFKKVGSDYEFCMPIVANTINDGNFDWTVDRCGSSTARYRVRITELASGEHDMSAGHLRIPDPGQSPQSLAQVTVPNPFRVNALVTFDLDEDSGVQAAIYNVSGQVIRSLIDGTLSSGRHDIAWDAKDYTGATVPSGIYYLKATIDGALVTKKILLIH